MAIFRFSILLGLTLALAGVGTTSCYVLAADPTGAPVDVPTPAAEIALPWKEDFEARLRALEAPPTVEQPAKEKTPAAPAKPVASTPSINWTGQVQTDFVWFDQSDLNRQTVGPLQDGVAFRRARLGAFGDIYELVEYRIEMDFALAGRPSFLDNWVGVKDVPHLGSLRVGHFFEPFSLERVTPNRFSTFMERSLVDQFAPARNTGVMAWDHLLDGNVTWASGLFRSNSNDFGDDVGNGDQWATTSRVTWSPGFDRNDRRYLLHFGAAYSLRGTEDRQVRFSDRPEIRMAAAGRGEVPRFVDTGNLDASQYQLFGAEMAVVYQAFSVQTEYVHAEVSQSDQGNASFHGMYVFGSFFLTGEHRPYFRSRAPYRRNNGVFDRVTPNTNAFCGPDSRPACNPGIGAWEVAVRWSHLDLNSGDIRGGRLNNLTYGLNWYLNPYTRVQWNYIRPLLDDPQFGSSTADIYAMRVGFDF
jgi:phosphate-selective porin OprO and OprP